MHKTDVARVLGQIAAFLELKGENPFRVRAYRAAERAVAAYPSDLQHALASGALAELKGIGPATLEIIEEVVASGGSSALDELRDQVPPGLVDMLQISGLGVGKVRQIHESLGIDSLSELEDAARDGRLARLPRFGKKTARNILQGIALLRQGGGYRLFHHARDEARTLAGVLASMDEVRQVEIVGSVRRRRELIRDLDFAVLLAAGRQVFYDRMRQAPGVSDVLQETESHIALRFRSGTVADIYPSDERQFGFQMVCSTGADEHLAALTARATARGLTWDGTGIRRANAALPLPTEESVYAALDLPWIPPEMREGTGEVDEAADGHLPRLVSHGDLCGFLHCHSNYSDGTSTLADWAEAGAAGGYEYVGVTDHSEATAYAGGLAVTDIERQHREIDELNARQSGTRLLKGVEADILVDGSLDYTPAVRRRFDFIIGSVHTRFGMDESALTDRVLKAMDDPTMTILGHPTGRLLLSREPYPIDLDRVFAKAADRGIAVEINADPQRLDLDWRALRRAVAAGVMISIGADAHATAGMANVDIGIGIARKGWLTREQVLNTRPLTEFLAFAQRGR